MIKRYCDDHPVEEWKVIDALLPYTQFEISSHGRVRNTETGNYISVYGKTGYSKFTVCYKPDGFRKTVNMHKAMAVAFIPNPNNYRVVNHKDGNKQNYDLYNLEWTTDTRNLVHAKEEGLNKNWGENHGNAKLTDDQVEEILSSPHMKGVELARKYNVSPSAICQIRKGVRRNVKY